MTSLDGVPTTTRLLAKQTVRADDADALTRKVWEFPHEQSKCDWELKALPAKTHQLLFRLFLHDDPQVWQTLMVHTEADLTGGVFKDFAAYIIVCELLHDPDLKLTSTYIERDDPPSTNWITQQKIKAPWAWHRAKLEPARGSLVFGADGTMQFAPVSAAAQEAEKQPADSSKPKTKLPKVGEETEDASELGGGAGP